LKRIALRRSERFIPPTAAGLRLSNELRTMRGTGEEYRSDGDRLMGQRGGMQKDSQRHVQQVEQQFARNCSSMMPLRMCRVARTLAAHGVDERQCSAI
jgi:hypothetical protein